MSGHTYSLEEISAWEEVPAASFSFYGKQQKITVEAALRFLPGKRLVAKANVNGKTVLAKCFLGGSAQRHCNRELEGLENFTEAGIDTPAVIDTFLSSSFSFITTEFLADSRSLDNLWKSDLSDEHRIERLKEAIKTIARLHNNHSLHNDPHLDNFLISENRLFLIDGGGVHKQSSPITAKTALENLALFLSVLFPRYDALSLQAYPAYLKLHALPGFSEEDLAKAIQKKRKWRERYLEKVFRTCTDFVAESGFRRFQVIDRSEDCPALRSFLHNPDPCINAGKVLKRGRTNTVSVVTLDDGKKVFVKRYKSTKGFVHKYVRGFRPSRARNAWYCAHYLLRLLGVDTPKPLALLELRLGQFVSCSYLVTEYIDADDALSYFTQQKQLTPEVEQQAGKLVDILASLKSAYVFHGDMKATNFILTPERMMVIDLDQTKVYSSENAFMPLYRKDVKRFQRNWTGSPVAEQLFFLRS